MQEIKYKRQEPRDKKHEIKDKRQEARDNRKETRNKKKEALQTKDMRHNKRKMEKIQIMGHCNYLHKKIDREEYTLTRYLLNNENQRHSSGSKND